MNRPTMLLLQRLVQATQQSGIHDTQRSIVSCLEWVVSRPETEDSESLLRLLESELRRRAVDKAELVAAAAARSLQGWPWRQGWAICSGRLDGGKKGPKARWLVACGPKLYRFKDPKETEHLDDLDLAGTTISCVSHNFCSVPEPN